MLRTVTRLVLFLSLVLSAGCRKRPATPLSTPAPVEAAAPAIEPAPAASQDAPAAVAAAEAAPAGDKMIEERIPTAPPESSKTSPIHKPLTVALRNYQIDFGKLPQDFNALVANKYLQQLPQPPPGKKFALDRVHMQIVIVDR
jgi:hypothetical protein